MFTRKALGLRGFGGRGLSNIGPPRDPRDISGLQRGSRARSLQDVLAEV